MRFLKSRPPTVVLVMLPVVVVVLLILLVIGLGLGDTSQKVNRPARHDAPAIGSTGAVGTAA